MRATARPATSLGAAGSQRVLLGAQHGDGSPMHLGVTHVHPGQTTDMIEHDTAEIAYVLSGGGWMVTGTDEQSFHPGDAVLIEPRCWHAIRAGSDPVEMLYVFPAAAVPATRHLPTAGEPLTVATPGWWPDGAVTCYEDLISYRLVGASACADRITTAMTDLAVAAQAAGRDVCVELTEAGRSFCSLKPDTALYVNVIGLLVDAARDGGAGDVVDRADALAHYRERAIKAVVEHAASLLVDAQTLLVHDYSSMVLRVVAELGRRRPRRVIVTAGEPLGQGERVAELAGRSGHEVVYTPDMSVARVIGGVDVFLTGVEAFYADGSLANTVGTVMLGLLCREHAVPVIAPAELLKYDRGPASADAAALTARLLHPWPPQRTPGTAEKWSVEDHVLDALPAQLVTTYATEMGISAPHAVGELARHAIGALAS